MELRTDIYFEYDDIFKVVRIFQVIERSELMTDYKPVGYEHATNEAEAEEVVEKFRRENRKPVLPKIEFTHG